MFVSFPQDYVDHAIIAITYIIKHEDMIMINQSTKEKGRWVAARILCTFTTTSRPTKPIGWISIHVVGNLTSMDGIPTTR